MNQPVGDISRLARAGGGEGGEEESFAGPAGGAVPMPRVKWKTRILLPSVIFVATAGTVLLAAGRALWPATAVRVVPVVVKSGAAATGKAVVQAPGWVEADPFPTAVSALADGVVSEVLVLEGQTVEAGQVVAKLVDADAMLGLAKAEAAVQEAASNVAAADADLKAAERDWDNPIELRRKLAASQAELAEKQAELARWPAELAAEEAMAAYKETEYLRVKPLYESDSASSIELVRAQKEYENQKAIADSTRARKPIIEAQIAAMEAEVAAAKEHLKLRIGDTKMLEAARAGLAKSKAALVAAEAARDEAKLRLDRMEVRSPAAGVVMTRLVEPGSKLMLDSQEMRSAQVARLYDPRKLQVRVDVPLADAAKVGVGQEAEVVVDVLPERVFKGRLTRIVNEADVQKNTLQVKVAIENPAPEIKPEMLARAKFFAGSEAAADGRAQRLLLPESVLMRHAGGHVMVWLADQARNIATSRTVTVGRGTADGWVEIETGVQPGDRAIANPPEGLEDGARIRIVGEASTDSPAAGVATVNAPATMKGEHHGTH